MPKVQWEEMFLDELEAAFQKCPLVYFTYGLCEPHGPHNALGLDALKAHAIACRAAERHGGIVAPPDYWHIHEVGGYAVWAHEAVGLPPRNWTTSVPPWQHFKNICYHIRTADALGFQAAILLTGHYGPNWEDLKKLVELLQPLVGTRLYALPEFESNFRGFSGDGTQTGDHAGKVETSLLWALRPELVDASRMPAKYTPGQVFAMGQDAYESSRLVGERMVEDEIEFFGAKTRELILDYERVRPAHTFTTFASVEQAWKDVVEPELPSFESMKMIWAWQKEIPADSPWNKNRAIGP